MTQASDAGRPAATVVVVRDRPGLAPDILMMERAATMAFAAGALVFPGGAVEEGDWTLAERFAGQLALDDAAARMAAIRETLEESGLGIGLQGLTDAAQPLSLRASLSTGESMGMLLERHGLGLALDELVPFARWHPADAERVQRIYDTRFYLARMPEGQEASADGAEAVRLFWCSAADTIARCDAGEGRIIFPTRRNLERLAGFNSFDELAAHAASTPVEAVRPWIEQRDGRPHLCIPTHLGYPVCSEPIATVSRG